MNLVWGILILVSIILSFFSGTANDAGEAMLTGAADAIALAIRLAALMAFWSGMMKILERAGAISLLTRLLTPLLSRLFPSLLPSSPALHAIAANLSANLLGLGNAATPQGLKAMKLLEKEGAEKSADVFVLLNTACFALLPTNMIALRVAAGSKSPASVVPFIWLVSGSCCLLALILERVTRRWR